MAITSGVSVIDASLTIGALHQTSDDGNKSGFNNRDANYNNKLIGLFNYSIGVTSNAQTRTIFEPLLDTVRIERNPTSPYRIPNLILEQTGNVSDATVIPVHIDEQH